MISQPKRSYVWLFWLLACIGLIADQASKYAIFATLYRGPGLNDIQPLIPGAFRLTADYSADAVPDTWLKPLREVSGGHMPRVNHGALFGIGNRDEHGNDGNLFFSTVSMLAALAIVLWITRTGAGQDRFLCISLGLILAGTLGNFYDRMVFDGVRDFLHWYYLVDWPVFNLADCCLVCGAGMLLVQALFLQPRTEEQTAAALTQDSALPEVVDVK